MKIDHTTLFYLFSVIATTYAAIIAVVGALVLYRFINLGQLEAETKNLVNPVFLKLVDKSVYEYASDEMVKACEAIYSEKAQDARDKGILKHSEGALKNIFNHRPILKQKFKCFLLFHLGLIAFSILLLPWSNSLAECLKTHAHLQYVLYLFLMLCVYASAYLIYDVGKYVMEIEGVSN
jgi:hypothetical protein